MTSPLPPPSYIWDFITKLARGEGGVVNILSQPDPTAAPPGGYPSCAPLATPLNSSAPRSDTPVTSACDPPGDTTSAPDTPPCGPLGDPSSSPPAAPPSRNALNCASPFASPG